MRKKLLACAAVLSAFAVAAAGCSSEIDQTADVTTPATEATQDAAVPETDAPTEATTEEPTEPPLLEKAEELLAQNPDTIGYISIEGTDNRNYEVEIKVKTVKTLRPGKLYHVMLSNNPGKYKNNQVLDAGMNGYEVEIYKCMYDKKDGHLQNENFLSTYSYEARDSVVVKLQDAPVPETSVPSTSTGTSTPATSVPATESGNGNGNNN